MSRKTLAELEVEHQQELKNFADAQYQAWQPVVNAEKELLKIYGGTYEQAPKDMQRKINQAREDYYYEWGSKGRLLAEITKKQALERVKCVRAENYLKRLEQTRMKGKNNEWIH